DDISKDDDFAVRQLLALRHPWFFEDRGNHSIMFRTSNEEPGDPCLEAPWASAPAQISDGRIQSKPSFGRRERSASPSGPVPYARGGLRPRALRRVREHIDGNIDQRIKVDALAKLANLSVCYFVRAFKQSVGVTPHDYVIRRRLERTME